MRIVLASDHAGFLLKNILVSNLKVWGHHVDDLGTHTTDSTDYPDYAKLVATKVAAGAADFGVLICGSGIGMCMTANRIKGVRAAVLRDEQDAKLSREHNNANVACFGERRTNPQLAQQLLEIFLSTSFEGGRHQQRVDKIEV